MFVLASGAVWAAAGAEFDLAPVEMFLELDPVCVGRRTVLLGGALLPPAVQEVLVVAYHVLVEDSHIAASGLDVEVAEQCRADVDRQTAVYELGGEEPSKIVGREDRTGERGVR